MTELPKLLTIDEVVALLEHTISGATIRREIKRGRLRAVKLGRFFRVREDDLRDYLDRDWREDSSEPKKKEKGSRPGARRRGRVELRLADGS